MKKILLLVLALLILLFAAGAGVINPGNSVNSEEITETVVSQIH